MKKILSTKISDSSINMALLVLRLAVGILMAHHGYQKLTRFAEIQPKFMDFLGLGKSISLSLVIGAEFFCSLLLVFGLGTRFILVPLIVTMTVAVFKAHSGDVFGDGETAFLYLADYIGLLLTGAGKYSADNYLFTEK